MCNEPGRKKKGGPGRETAWAQGAAGAAATGPSGSEEEPSGVGSQKAILTPRETHEEGRVATKVAHSLLQAGLMSTPFQQVVIRTSAGVQPGHALWWSCRRMGHSKGLWGLPGYARSIGHEQALPAFKFMERTLRVLLMMTGDSGLQQVSGGGGPCRGGASGSYGGSCCHGGATGG